MKASNKKSTVTIAGDNLADFVADLIKNVGDKKLSEIKWSNVNFQYGRDYSECYYEGDLPTVEIERVSLTIDV